jgi:hypothetical protein
MKRILLTAMFVLSLFLMCGGCEDEHHAQRKEQPDRGRHSDRWNQDRDSNRHSPER